jgi:hypothetical protein
MFDYKVLQTSLQILTLCASQRLHNEFSLPGQLIQETLSPQTTQFWDKVHEGRNACLLMLSTKDLSELGPQ